MSNHYDPDFEASEIKRREERVFGLGGVPAQREASMQLSAKIEQAETVRTQGDHVTRPAHYGGEANPFEQIKIIEHYQLGFHEGNVLKYLLRWRSKDGIKDLQKALYYLQRFVEREVRMREKP